MTIALQIIRTFLILSGCLFSTIVFAQDDIVEKERITTTTLELANKKMSTTESVKVNQSQQSNHLTQTAALVETPIELNDQLIQSVETKPINNITTKDTPQVGKHVMANMNASSMIVSLLMVLVLIVICAFILKRFNLVQQGGSQLKVVANLSLGSKERVIVVQVGDQQFVLGVTSQQINLLEKLSEPLATNMQNTIPLPKSVLSFISSKKS
jgi:flagellar protein FliO/FliZ